MIDPALIEAANQHPLNLHAKKLLRQSSEPADPSMLYLLQLAIQRAETYEIGLELLPTLEAMRDRWLPVNAMAYFLLNEALEPTGLLDLFQATSDMETGADLLLEELESRMTALTPGYPPPRNLMQAVEGG